MPVSSARPLAPGDGFLVGADLMSRNATCWWLRRSLGVTAAFNGNLLVRINRELGADFDLDGFSIAPLEPACLRIEMHLSATRPQYVRVPVARLEFAMKNARRSGRKAHTITDATISWRCSTGRLRASQAVD